MKRPPINWKLIKATLRSWAAPRKEAIWKYLGKVDYSNYDDTPRAPGTRGRPRLPTTGLSKADKWKRKQSRKGSDTYWRKHRELVLLKAASTKTRHNKPFYKLFFGF